MLYPDSIKELALLSIDVGRGKKKMTPSKKVSYRSVLPQRLTAAPGCLRTLPQHSCQDASMSADAHVPYDSHCAAKFQDKLDTIFFFISASTIQPTSDRWRDTKS
jgi:hypothetical protein